MASKPSTFRNMVISLVSITLAASTALALVYNVTKAPIAKVQIENKNASIQLVLPAFDNAPFAEQFKIESEGNDSLVCYPAKSNGQLVGIAIETSSNKGYSGKISIMVGFKPDGTINNYSVIEHKETPGLGTKMADWFKTDKKDQSILGKNPASTKLKVKKDGGDVDAITAATISSRAFCESIQRAYDAYINSQKQSDTTQITQ
jgi:electron transport complex protein RnfG